MSGSPSESAASNLYRHRGEAWDAIGPAQSCEAANYPESFGSGPAAVAATDGAIWAGTTQGLARLVVEDSQVVASSGLCPQFSGPNGAVWARAGDEVVLVGPDGTTEPIQLPDGTDVCRWAAGVDPAVWISSPVRPPVKDPDEDGQSDEPCDAAASTLQRWDGNSWAEVAPPDPDVPVVAMAVTDDGAAWALSYSKGTGSISRYADGRWTTLSTGTPYPLKFAAGPGGRVCSLESNRTFYFGDRLTCLDSSGEAARFDLEGMWDFSIAPDGAVWVAGPEVARIAETLPGGDGQCLGVGSAAVQVHHSCDWCRCPRDGAPSLASRPRTEGGSSSSGRPVSSSAGVPRCARSGFRAPRWCRRERR